MACRARSPKRGASRQADKRSAFRELEGPAGLRLAVLLALDHAAVAREEPDRFQHRTQPRLVIDQRAADAVTHRAGLARETADSGGAGLSWQRWAYGGGRALYLRRRHRLDPRRLSDAGA